MSRKKYQYLCNVAHIYITFIRKHQAKEPRYPNNKKKVITGESFIDQKR